MIKKYNKIIVLTLFFIIYYLLTTKFGKYLYGSMLDWNCQHYYIPDYFRKLFYKTGDLFPSFAFNLGAGQNIYNLSYYGYLSPIILISYLLPFVSMKTYIQISSLLLVYFSVILFYKWISTKFNSKISTVSTILFMLSTCLLFHSHRHIMFINYMPFLILGLIGVDNYFNKRKKTLLMISVFLICITSYFFSIASILVLLIYGIYIYLKINKSVTLKVFINDGIKFILPIIIGIISSIVVLLPTFLAILNGRGKGSVVINLLSLITPKIHVSYILYNTYSPGLISISLFSLIYLIFRFKNERRFLGIALSTFIIFPIFLFLLNGGMYINTKVLIPFVPLYIFSIAITVNDIIENKKLNFIYLILYIIVILLGYIFDYKNNLFLIDSLITIIGLLLYIRFKKSYFILVPIVVMSFISFVISSNSDNLVLRDSNYDLSSSNILVDFAQTFDKDMYRFSNRNGGLGTANDVKNFDFYKSSIYSSVSNQYYQNFYYNLIGNDILNRSRGQLSDPKNLLFNIYMGNKYLISPKTNEYGYDEINNIDNNYLYKNSNVLPIGYSRSNVMNKIEFNKLKYPYSVEALLNYIIVDDITDTSDYKTNIEEINLDYKILETSNVRIDNTNEYININSKANGKLTLNINNDLRNKILFIKFDLIGSNSCGVGDNAITINNIINKLTCRNWKYNNGNYSFEYTISNKNIDKLDIKFDKGNYKIKNIKTYVIDYGSLVNGYSNYSKFEIDNSKIKDGIIEGNINVYKDSYFNISIPYDKGFVIYLDDKKIDYEKTDLSFIGFKINKGHHKIKMVYSAPGLKVSKMISIFGIMYMMITFYVERKVKIKKR